jgi:predicted transposase YdaD
MTPEEVIEKVIERFRSLPVKEQRNWLEKLMIISGIRGYEEIVRKEAEKMGISLDIRDNKFFQEAYAVGIEDGLKQGIGQGIEEGEATILLRLLDRRFGPLPEWVREKIERMDRAMLEEAGLRLLDAKTLEDVFPPQQSN